MATKLTRSPHHPGSLQPVLFRPGGRGQRSWRAACCRAEARPITCPRARETSRVEARLGLRRGWRRQALRETLVATLFTSLLTSAVLAAPDAFRQSPVVSWRQFTTAGLAVGPLPGQSVLVDCP